MLLTIFSLLQTVIGADNEGLRRIAVIKDALGDKVKILKMKLTNVDSHRFGENCLLECVYRDAHTAIIENDDNESIIDEMSGSPALKSIYNEVVEYEEVLKHQSGIMNARDSTREYPSDAIQINILRSCYIALTCFDVILAVADENGELMDMDGTGEDQKRAEDLRKLAVKMKRARSAKKIIDSFMEVLRDNSQKFVKWKINKQDGDLSYEKTGKSAKQIRQSPGSVRNRWILGRIDGILAIAIWLLS